MGISPLPRGKAITSLSGWLAVQAAERTTYYRGKKGCRDFFVPVVPNGQCLGWWEVGTEQAGGQSRGQMYVTGLLRIRGTRGVTHGGQRSSPPGPLPEHLIWVWPYAPPLLLGESGALCP